MALPERDLLQRLGRQWGGAMAGSSMVGDIGRGAGGRSVTSTG